VLIGVGQAGFGPVAADTANPTTTTKASTTTQTDVTAPGPLTGLTDGAVVTVNVTGPSGGFRGVDARLCRPGVEINSVNKFDPTGAGNCVDAPLGGSDDFVHADQDTTNTSATLEFKVGVGTNTVEFGGSFTRLITCDGANPCTLWLSETVDPSESNPLGLVWVHFDLNFAGGGTPATTTTTTPATTTTTATGGTSSTTSASTSTTQGTGTSSTTISSTSTTLGTGSTTSTTVAPLTATPSSLPVGAELTVASTGWKSEAVITATLNSDPVTLGTMTANSSGAVTAKFTIPASVALGAHSLVLTGTGANNASRELKAAVTVTDGSTTTTTKAGAGNLARTGSDVMRLVLSGAALWVAGYLFVVTVRRRERISGP